MWWHVRRLDFGGRSGFAPKPAPIVAGRLIFPVQRPFESVFSMHGAWGFSIRLQYNREMVLKFDFGD